MRFSQPIDKESKLPTFTRSSNGTTKGSSVRTASCLSSDTDSGGDSRPTVTRWKPQSLSFPDSQSYPSTAQCQTFHRRQSYRSKGQPWPRGWGGEAGCRVHGVRLTQQYGRRCAAQYGSHTREGSARPETHHPGWTAGGLCAPSAGSATRVWRPARRAG